MAIVLSEKIYTYVYISEVVSDISPKEFSQIISNSRANNLAKNISGILFYDGAHFFQYLEGEASNLAEVISKIEGSSQHQNIQLLYKNKLPLEARKFANWELGYVDCVNHASIFDTFAAFIQEKSDDFLEGHLLKIEQAMLPMIKSSDIL